MWQKDYEILCELIADNARIKPSKNFYDKNQITLTETDPQNSYSVVIESVPNASFVFKSDKFPSPKAIFNNKKMNVNVPIIFFY